MPMSNILHQSFDGRDSFARRIPHTGASLDKSCQARGRSSSNNQEFSFIVCGGPSDATTTASRRKVRSQAAKRCSEQRKATIAQRYGSSFALKPNSVQKRASSKRLRRKQSKDASTDEQQPSAGGGYVGSMSPQTQDERVLYASVESVGIVGRCKGLNVNTIIPAG